MDTFYRIELFVAAVTFTLACFVYGLTSWRKTWPGRVLFVVLLNFSVVLLLIVWSYWVGAEEHTLREFLRFSVYTATALNGIIILFSVIAGQLLGTARRRRKQRESSGTIS